MGGSYDVILVLHPFRNNEREFQILVRPLEALEGDCLIGAEGLYNPKTDTALIVLRFSDDAVKRLGAYTIHLFAGRSGLPMIVPARLKPEERRAFFVEHLSASYNVYVQMYPCKAETDPLVERTILTVAGHVANLPHIEPPSGFDIEREMPLFYPSAASGSTRRRKPRRSEPPWRGASSPV